MTTEDVQLEQAINEVQQQIGYIALWKDYQADDLKNIERVERMRASAFKLQEQLEQLDSAIINQKGTL